MTFQPKDEAEASPQWKRALLEKARQLELVRQRNEELRKANQEVMDWIATQPPQIKDTSIGK
jgi:hypothetical protein